MDHPLLEQGLARARRELAAGTIVAKQNGTAHVIHNTISPRENVIGQSPRIYNLHPLLAGPIDRWPEHLPRIAAMRFDWVYVNAFWEPGASRSIYAVRNPYELHPLVRGEARGDAAKLTAEFFRTAADHGLEVMVDLIVPHAARDATLGGRATRVVSARTGRQCGGAHSCQPQ